jgi:hypothetical protein
VINLKSSTSISIKQNCQFLEPFWWIGTLNLGTLFFYSSSAILCICLARSCCSKLAKGSVVSDFALYAGCGSLILFGSAVTLNYFADMLKDVD